MVLQPASLENTVIAMRIGHFLNAFVLPGFTLAVEDVFPAT